MSKKRIRAERTTLLNWGGADREVIVIPATAEAYEQMVEQMARAMYLDDVGLRRGELRWGTTAGGVIVETFISRARAAFRAIGITPPKKGQP